MARFARERLRLTSIGSSELRYQLFYSYLLPQFEGISDEEARKLWARQPRGRFLVGKYIVVDATDRAWRDDPRQEHRSGRRG